MVLRMGVFAKYINCRVTPLLNQILEVILFDLEHLLKNMKKVKWNFQSYGDRFNRLTKQSD